MAKLQCVTFLSDFGLADESVACCKGLLLRRGVSVPLLDISHDIQPFDIITGGWMLAGSLQYMPVGVHLAVVDPGVGTVRRILAAQASRGDMIVGPDNGLLLPALERLGGVSSCHAVETGRFELDAASPTFQARDIMAPVVADLIGGAPLESVGPEIAAGELAPYPAEPPVRSSARVNGSVVCIDTFGTVRTNIPWSWFQEKGGEAIRISCGWLFSIPVGRTFADVSSGEMVVLEDSWGYVSIAVNRGSASDILGFKAGDLISVEFTMPGSTPPQ